MVEILRDRVGPDQVEDTIWDLEKFRKEFDVRIAYLTDTEANFDLINIDTSFANAFRRIMLAEVPTVAIEKVFIEMNTSVIQDEVLSQRLGLVPIAMSPDWLDWVEDNVEEEQHNTRNTVVFSLNVKCERNPSAPKGSNDPEELYLNSNVYARDLKFEPRGSQLEYMNPAPTVAAPDILLAKLRPGQEISMYCWAVLGIGSEHAKWSPVCTATYRMMPTITITEDIPSEHAKKFQDCFAPGVVSIRSDGRPEIADSRKDTMSREVLRHPEFSNKVKLGRNRSHFIFNVESTGAMEPDEVFVKSINHLRNKARELLDYELK